MNVFRLFSTIVMLTMLLSSVAAPEGRANASPPAQGAQPPDLRISKAADDPEVSVGEPIGFTIALTNAGAGAVTNVQVIDRLPEGTSWSFDHPACFITAEGWLVCEFVELAAGAGETVHLTAASTPAMCGLVSNRAAAQAAGYPKAVSNTAVVEVVDCPGLIVSKISDAAWVNAGDPIGFTLTVLNNGLVTAQDVALTDQLLAGIGWSQNSDACQVDEAGLLTCAFGDLPAGAEARVHVSAITSDQMCMLVQNTVTVTAGNISGELTATAEVDVRCPADLTVEKTADPASVANGDTIRFNLVVASIGQSAAEGATLQDVLPAAPGLSWTVESVTGGGSCGITGGQLACSFGTMPPGSTRTVVVASPTTAGSCGVHNNQATVTASNEDDSHTGNNSDDAAVTVNCGSLAIDKTADLPDEVAAGDPIGFTITVTNEGDTTAAGVTLEDRLDPRTDWSEDSPACAVSAGQVLACDFGDLAPGASASVRVSADSSEAMCGVLENTATATAQNPPGSVSDDAAIVIHCPPNITVRKVPAQEKIACGQTARFDMVVANTGSGAAENVTLTDPLPVVTGLDWAFAYGAGGGTCEINAGRLDCSFGTLEPAESASVSISAATPDDMRGRIVNTVTARATNDPDPASDIAEMWVTCGPDVTIAKTAEDEAFEASATTSARFTITVRNHGTETATGVKLTDELPPDHRGLDWTIESVTGGGSCSLNTAGDPDTITCDFGSLAPGEERTVVVSSPAAVGDFCPNPAGTLLHNYAEVSAENEAEEARYDNSADATVRVTCPTIDDPQCEPFRYQNNFDSGTPGAGGWTNYRTDISPNKTREFLGRFNNETVTFELASPNPQFHYALANISFDLYIIQSWDGNSTQIGPGSPVVGPDFWRFGLQDASGVSDWMVDTTFTNFDSGSRYESFRQSYPRAYFKAAYPGMTGAAEWKNLGYQFDGPRDAAYHFTFTVLIPEQVVRLVWMGDNLQMVDDESWAIDNLVVDLPCALPSMGLNYWFPAVFTTLAE